MNRIFNELGTGRKRRSSNPVGYVRSAPHNTQKGNIDVL